MGHGAKLPYSGPGGWFIPAIRRNGCGSVQIQDHKRARDQGPRQGSGELQAQGLDLLPPTLLGRTDPWFGFLWRILKRGQTEGILRNLLPSDPVTRNRMEPSSMPCPLIRTASQTARGQNYQPAGTGESPLATITDWLEIWFDSNPKNRFPAPSPNPKAKAGCPPPRDQHHAAMGRFLLVSPATWIPKLGRSG